MNLSDTLKTEWLHQPVEPIEPLVHGQLKRTLEILDELEQRDPLAIEGLVEDYDLREADPILNHAPAVRSKVDADRLLRILNEIAREDAQ